MKPKYTYNEIFSTYQAIEKLAPRLRLQQIKALGYIIYDFYHDSEVQLSAVQLKLFIDVLRQYRRFFENQKFARLLAALITEYNILLTGNKEVEVFTKKSKKLKTESATIAICSLSAMRDITTCLQQNNHFTNDPLIDLVNNNHIFCVGTGRDGIIVNVQVRVVNAPEPVLSIKESKFVTNSSEQTLLNFPESDTSQVIVADLYSLDSKSNSLAIPITPGVYKVAVYTFEIRNKISSYYFVLAPTGDLQKNKIKKMDTLELSY